MEMNYYYIETYGCTANQHDTEVIEGILEQIGFKRVEDPNKAGLLLLNTCIVKKTSEDRMRARIKQLNKLNRFLVVTGCMAEALPNVVKKIAPRAIILSPHYLDKLYEIIKNINNNPPDKFVGKRVLNKTVLPRKINGKLIEPVTISQGCLGSCTFCITKFARGSLRSYPIDDIISDIKRLINAGVKEIRLTSQDTGIYGIDIGVTLVDLLEKISRLEGDFMVRLGMSSPDSIIPIIDNIIDILKEDKRFYRYFHLPVQSGSDKILESMRRNHTATDFINLVKKIRSKLGEDTTIATDIIVAFPGESEEDFKSSIEMLEKTYPDIVNVSRYGDRPMTLASKMYPKVHSGVAKERSRIISRIVRKISLERNLSYVGKTIDVLLLEKNSNSRIAGRTRNYKNVVAYASSNSKLGDWETVHINEVTFKTLYGALRNTVRN